MPGILLSKRWAFSELTFHDGDTFVCSLAGCRSKVRILLICGALKLHVPKRRPAIPLSAKRLQAPISKECHSTCRSIVQVHLITLCLLMRT